MKVLILDPDPRIKDYLTSLLRAEFSDLQGHFATSINQALEALQINKYDLVIMENSFSDEELFSTLRKIKEQNTPVLFIGSDTSERLIVELIRAGAADYVSKRNVKFGYLPSLIRRILLETEGNPVPVELNEEIRSHMQEDRDERRRYQITRGLVSASENFIEGQTYNLIYLFMYLPFVASNAEDRDDQQMGNLRKEIMGKLSVVCNQYGGNMWTRKEDTALFVFESHSVMGSLLTTLEMRGLVRMFNLTVENLNGSFYLRAGITRSPAVYHDNHGDVVSDGINLAAHMAFSADQDEAILMTEALVQEMVPRARKYFFKEPPFERQTIYRYENTA